MKKIVFLIVLIFSVSCQKDAYFTKELLAEKVLESLQKNDLEAFKKCFPSFEFVQKIVDMNASEYTNFVTEAFVAIQKEFKKGGDKASNYELFKINEPYRTYELDGFSYIKYSVILKNNDNIYLKMKFSDCVKTSDGFKLGERIDVLMYNN